MIKKYIVFPFSVHTKEFSITNLEFKKQATSPRHIKLPKKMEKN